MAAGTGKTRGTARSLAGEAQHGGASSAEELRRVSDLLRCVSEPARLFLLLTLSGGEREPASLAEALGVTIASTVHHLTLLRSMGLLHLRRDGIRRRYELTDLGQRLVAAIDASHLVDIAPSVDELIALPDADWIPLNNRRGDLIHKNTRYGLVAEERDELERLQAASVIRTRRDFPAPTRLIEEIRALKAQLRGDVDAK